MGAPQRLSGAGLEVRTERREREELHRQVSAKAIVGRASRIRPAPSFAVDLGAGDVAAVLWGIAMTSSPGGVSTPDGSPALFRFCQGSVPVLRPAIGTEPETLGHSLGP